MQRNEVGKIIVQCQFGRFRNKKLFSKKQWLDLWTLPWMLIQSSPSNIDTLFHDKIMLVISVAIFLGVFYVYWMISIDPS